MNSVEKSYCCIGDIHIVFLEMQGLILIVVIQEMKSALARTYGCEWRL
jgi:hypothetical protein